MDVSLSLKWGGKRSRPVPLLILMLCFQVVLWSTLFKYHLELGHYREAYEAMMANPDPIRSAVYIASLQ